MTARLVKFSEAISSIFSRCRFSSAANGIEDFGIDLARALAVTGRCAGRCRFRSRDEEYLP